MNKIYKVVWNNTLQCYTVVSELAKSHTKNNASKVVKATVLSSLLAVTSSTYATQVGGVITENDLPLIVDGNTQNVTVDSINVTKVSNTGPNSIGISGGRTLTVNDDLTVSTSSTSTSNYLQIWAVNWADDPVNNKFDPSSTLHVKGNFNVFNLNENSELSLEDSVLLTNLANTTVDGNVNLKSHAIYKEKRISQDQMVTML